MKKMLKLVRRQINFSACFSGAGIPRLKGMPGQAHASRHSGRDIPQIMRKNLFNGVLGFSIIEMMVVLVIIGIIIKVAISSFSVYVLESHRTDGINAILALQLAEERYRSINTQYGTVTQIGGSTASPQGYYTLSITGTSASAYIITATGQGSQANDAQGNTSCATLTLTVSNGTVTQTPAACWPS